ncbi:AraC family transcriptional regulator [Paenibacillus sp. IB182496]|uniref:AraC family transcriptional regulator n=1 Tax=Paenibacillus sabuli TaxID=2772509 RepID=A0A927GPP0_9BACL|nr:helix-turn-helix domain-containing protein [Paenibacillus sabuli]MBD2843674.1 AraC family transcriptional regulator [Paenibacillus sabuli]
MAILSDPSISAYPIRLYNQPGSDAPVSARLPSLQLVNAGHLPGRTLQRRAARFSRWACVYITGGSGYYQVDDGPLQPVEAGSLFWLHPEAVFHYGPWEGAYWDEYYFTFEGTRIHEWLANWALQPLAVTAVGLDEARFGRMELMFRLIDSGMRYNLDRAALLLEQFVYELVHQVTDEGVRGQGERAHQIVEDLNYCIYEAIDARGFAARHHISVSTLRRIVHAHTGYPFNEYLHRLKTAEAKSLLRGTSDSVKTISGRLGYKDVYYFSRLFKKYTGVSPKFFRQFDY